MMETIKLYKPWQQGLSLLAGCLVAVMVLGCGATENNGSQEIKSVTHETETSLENITSRKFKSFNEIGDSAKKYIEEYRCNKSNRDEFKHCLIRTFPIGTDINIPVSYTHLTLPTIYSV